jgi:hypothetical protein
MANADARNRSVDGEATQLVLNSDVNCTVART